MKKKFLIGLLVTALALCGLLGCGGPEEGSTSEGSLKVVATIFPLYDWADSILEGRDAEVTLLLDSGVDLHSYQPTAEDIRTISDCDVFIYVGGESDEWVEDALSEATNGDMVVLNMMDVIGDRAKEEEVKEGMEAEEEEGEGEEEEGPELDEHLWLSLKNAAVCCDAICEAFAKADRENASLYEENLAAYKEKLAALDKEYEAAVSDAKVKTLLFGDRFPFRYLVEDYGLDYYAAFVGCSAETEASFETIRFLAKKVDELRLENICVLESSDQKIARTIRDNTKRKDQEIVVFDSMQSTTAEDVEQGADYVEIMKGNLDALKKALQ